MTDFEKQAFEALRQITASLARQELMLKSLDANIERLALLRNEAQSTLAHDVAHDWRDDGLRAPVRARD
jgi:hypothetical protein